MSLYKPIPFFVVNRRCCGINLKSLVFIEIQDTRRMDYLSGKSTTVSNGSGFIISSRGIILTNAHVVINKPRSIVSVKLHDGRTFQGFVEAVDPICDLATARIKCKNLNAMKLGKSSDQILLQGIKLKKL
ncbi:hypothetical protein ACKWTF_012054 [Chironomus riparius]